MDVSQDESTCTAFEELVTHPHVSDYLAQLEHALAAYVPETEALRLIEESEDHLISLIQTLEEQGEGPESVHLAILEMGSPQSVADYFIEAWYLRPSRLGPLERRLGPGLTRTLIWFGAAEFLLWTLLQARIFLPAYGSVQLPWSPATVRRYFPEPLPFPDFSLRFLLIIVLPIVLPPLLGYAVGRQVPVRPHIEVAKVVIGLAVFSYAIGLLLLPVTDGVILAILQLAYWLPMASLTAHLTRYRRRPKSPPPFKPRLA